ncbi:4-hydroxy-tetrahydrodipicolinate reductase [Serratia symbiotica]|nr:4-hydroxy-tetrahydrodipicolinate reductase [Serratia symbiotica]
MNNSKIRIAITGANGRMGQNLIRTIQKTKNVILAAALTHKNSNLIGIDIGELIGIKKIGIPLCNNLKEIEKKFDILIDFTSPSGTLKYLNFCIQENKPIIIGTTGFNEINKKIIYNAAKHIGVLYSPNFSISVNLMINLLKKTTEIIGKNSDIEIIETHHKYKKDTPSGTALKIGKIISKTLGYQLKDYTTYTKQKYINKKKFKNIKFTSFRIKDVLGEHIVIFNNLGEQLQIIHKTSNRSIFAIGAIHAAIWLHNRGKGFFSMKDVLNINF